MNCTAEMHPVQERWEQRSELDSNCIAEIQATVRGEQAGAAMGGEGEVAVGLHSATCFLLLH